jgi:hypothetical protein
MRGTSHPCFSCQSQKRAEMNPLFTAKQIADALGRTRQAVQWALASVKPDGNTSANGQVSNAWSIASLPASMQQELSAVAVQRGCRSVEVLLVAPQTYAPPAPLDQISDGALTKASKLMRAMLPMLTIHEVSCSAAEFERQGIEHYRSEFGYEISARRWRDLYSRTIRRDAGLQQWTRVELYLDENPARKPAADSTSG